MIDTPDFKIFEFTCRHCGTGSDIVKPALLIALQAVRNDWGQPMFVDAGYRCPAHNAAVGGAPNSAHMTGEAADVADASGNLKAWMTGEKLEGYGLWAEDYRATPTWIHLQIRPAAKRIFLP